MKQGATADKTLVIADIVGLVSGEPQAGEGDEHESDSMPSLAAEADGVDESGGVSSGSSGSSKPSLVSDEPQAGEGDKHVIFARQRFPKVFPPTPHGDSADAVTEVKVGTQAFADAVTEVEVGTQAHAVIVADVVTPGDEHKAERYWDNFCWRTPSCCCCPGDGCWGWRASNCRCSSSGEGFWSCRCAGRRTTFEWRLRILAGPPLALASASSSGCSGVRSNAYSASSRRLVRSSFFRWRSRARAAAVSVAWARDAASGTSLMFRCSPHDLRLFALGDGVVVTKRAKRDVDLSCVRRGWAQAGVWHRREDGCILVDRR
jgi:hypothetical protein